MKAADIPLTQIRAHDHNPRRVAVADDDMVVSVTAAGVLQAVTVAPAPESPTHDPADPTSRWVLIAGHRRVDACTKAALPTIPAVIRDDLLTDTQQLEAMLVENLHREDLTPVEEAHAYEQLQLFGMTPTAIAKATGRNAKTVKARLALVGLSEDTQQRLHDGQLTLDQAATLIDLTGKAPDLAADLEEHAGRRDWDYLATRAKDTLARRERNAANIAGFKDLAVEVVQARPGDENTMSLSRFPAALRDPDQHPECLGFYDYGADSYSPPVLVCVDTTLHDLTVTPMTGMNLIQTGETPRTREEIEAEWEERRQAENERRAVRAAARETRLRWLHTHVRGALGKASTRTPLLENLVPILLAGAPEYGYGPDQVQILATHLIATGKDPGPVLFTNIASSDTTREAEAQLLADVPGITGTVRVESAYATWLTAWVDYALTADMYSAYEDGHLTIFTAQLNLWTYLTAHGYPLSDVDEEHVAKITEYATEARDDAAAEAEQDSEAGQ